MSLLSKDASQKENKGNALVIGKEAREAKAKNPSVIDSTIGMLFDEEGQFLEFNVVEKISRSLSARQKYSYGSTVGDGSFHQALYEWIFKDQLKEIERHFILRSIATPGGSGAICNTFSNYLEEGQKVLLPSLMWTNYIQTAREEHLGYQTYELFNEEGSFNLKDFKVACKKLMEEQKRLLVVMNDPCQNPTGYSMKQEEWLGVIEILNEVSSAANPVILLYDMAYFDYDKRGSQAMLKNLLAFQNFSDNVLPILAFSGSKTLGLYGLRIGAQIAMTRSIEEANAFIAANEFSARGKWSGASTLGQNIIKEAFTTYHNEFLKEIGAARALLVKRANTFLEESKRVGLKHYPYDCGFFVAIPCQNPEIVFERLKEKGLYTIPLKQGIRLTLSSISVKEVIQAVTILKEVISKYE